MDSIQTCIFCRIAEGTTPCERLAENETAIAFMDAHPANDGHCLVIPKRHAATIFALSPDEFARVSRMAAEVAQAVQDALRPEGLSLVQANGAAAGQTVFHLHIHVLPRRVHDALALNWARTRLVLPSSIVSHAARIRALLAPQYPQQRQLGVD